MLQKITNKKSFQLFLTSCLALYLELIAIRWLSSEIRIFAFLKNIPLIISFLGLGLGTMQKSHKLIKGKNLPVILYIFIFSLVITPFTFISRVPIPSSEDLWIWRSSESFLSSFFNSTIFQTIMFFLMYIIIVTYFLTILFILFFAIGVLLKEKLSQFHPLKAYSIDLIGSMTGIVLFTIISFLWAPPIIWIALAFLILFIIIRPKKNLVLSGIIILSIVGVLTKNSYWSPYYKISIYKSAGKNDSAVNLGVNQVYFQKMADLSPKALEDNSDSEIKDFATNYNLPYWIIGDPGDILIVGAGAGNDVAAALRYNAKSIDAVEIDPVILKLGTYFHPEKPYQSPKVNQIIDDARSFFEKTDKKYDTIVFGLLDSHTSASTFSNIRLDNYVYTKESFQAASKHLKENGNLIVSFAAGKPWILNRIKLMITDAFAQEPIVFKRNQSADGAIFVIGKNTDYLKNPVIFERKAELPEDRSIIIPTDDWPYLYLKERSIPKLFLLTLAIVIMLSIILSFVFLDKNIVSEILVFNKERWHFFFLGVAFLLIEVKSINELSLLFGSTWIVNSSVILSILLMAYIANALVQKRIIFHPNFIIAGLFSSLIICYLFRVGGLVGQPFLVKFIGGGILTTLPLFFSGLLFSNSFEKTKHTTEVFGANLFGAFAGGIVENIGMITGIRNLTFFSIMFYAIAVYFILPRKK